MEFDFSGQRKITQHIGLVMEACSDKIITIDGSTSNRSEDHGGQVQRKERKAAIITGAWRPPCEMYEKEKPAVAKRYQHIGEIPETFRKTTRQLMGIEVISGRGSTEATLKDITLDTSYDMVRMLVFGYRGGAYDRALLAAGKPTVISPCFPPDTDPNKNLYS